MKILLAIIGGIVFCAASVSSAVAKAECGPGTPAGMEAFAKGIIVSICPNAIIYIDDELVPSADAVDFLTSKMSKNKRRPVTIFRHGLEPSDVVNELQELAKNGPKGSGVFFVFPGGQFFGGQND